jgi:hypothetical protein
MSPSDAFPASESVPPEVLAIAVALVALWPEAALELESVPDQPSPWRTGARRWERATSHRWS